MNKRGSSLLVVLALLIFITSLGTILIQSAFACYRVALDRASVHARTTLLESCITSLAHCCAYTWLSPDAEKKGIYFPLQYTMQVQGKMCEVTVIKEKDCCLVRAMYPSHYGKIVTRSAELMHDGKQVVIRAWHI